MKSFRCCNRYSGHEQLFDCIATIRMFILNRWKITSELLLNYASWKLRPFCTTAYSTQSAALFRFRRKFILLFANWRFDRYGFTFAYCLSIQRHSNDCFVTRLRCPFFAWRFLHLRWVLNQSMIWFAVSPFKFFWSIEFKMCLVEIEINNSNSNNNNSKLINERRYFFVLPHASFPINNHHLYN